MVGKDLKCPESGRERWAEMQSQMHHAAEAVWGRRLDEPRERSEVQRGAHSIGRPGLVELTGRTKFPISGVGCSERDGGKRM